MSQRPYSVEQVADLLGLHVKTVRGYVRDGRLKAVRIGKQYRIAREDLEAFTGHPVEPPAAETVRRSRHVEMSGIVQIDAIGREEMSRLSNTLMAAVAVRPYGDGNLRVETVYDEERGSMKIIILGGLDDAAELLKIINTLVKEPA
ncbi:helix-turn-helix domain-containing protein [Planobispora longispora]|uniref:MerR family transcriptional regulator n=1 Tax=Planobispora longispora TaxID=28887 RepID=A0A8J3RSY0_9ACTN|nr:helix-turn-helix domain-containing protein [Planobispora longispora]GIH80140.1 MerR family transcriptional regulator [Planobispora longispora]